MKEKRPWGYFDTLVKNKNVSVKLLYLQPYSRTSLQYHEHRKERWWVLEGHPHITISDITQFYRPGDYLEVPKWASHRIEAGELPVKILEIMHGRYKESDIKRLQDDYGRVKDLNKTKTN